MAKLNNCSNCGEKYCVYIEYTGTIHEDYCSLNCFEQKQGISMQKERKSKPNRQELMRNLAKQLIWLQNQRK